MTAYYNEIDPFCCQWLRNLVAAGLIAPGDVDERDIRDIHPTDLNGYRQHHFFAGIGVWSHALRLAGWPDDREVWTGSCPCQPFSAAGGGTGFADERHLWPHWFHLIEQCRPRVVFGEQVASKDGLAWLDLVQADLEGAGYACGAVDLCAAGVGAPHIRQRLWFVANALGADKRRYAGDMGSAAAPSGRETWPQDGHTADRASTSGLLADADGRDARAEGLQRGRQYGQQPQDGRAVLLGHPGGAGPQERPQPEIEPGALRIQGATLGEAEPLRGFWRGADWIFCRDGKYRPVGPGSFPLAHGTPARVGRLRAYGNAIVAQAAQAFIEAYLGTRTDSACQDC